MTREVLVCTSSQIVFAEPKYRCQLPCRADGSVRITSNGERLWLTPGVTTGDGTPILYIGKIPTGTKLTKV